MKIFLVGGAVRDKLLGLEPKDEDFVVVGSTPAEMLELGFKQVGVDFPVFLHPETGDEFALARKERSTGSSHTDFECDIEGVTLEEDLERRDLTINSMALSEDGTLIDPFNGSSDLQNKVLRMTSSAFMEDPLRVLRLARFHARLGKEWTIDLETWVAMREMFRQVREEVSSERIWKEIERALTEPEPWLFLSILCDVFGIEVTEKDTLEMLDRLGEPELDPEKRWAIFGQCLFKDEFNELVERVNPPKVFREWFKVANICLPDIHFVEAEEVLQLAEQVDFFRKPHRLEWCCEIHDWMFLEKFPDNFTTEKWRKLGEELLKIKAQPFVAMGLTGPEIGDKIRLERLRTTKEVLDEQERT